MKAEKKPKIHKDKPVYLRVKKMVDPETGELQGCLVPVDHVACEILRQRHTRTGDLVRATLSNPRNVKFHRLVHQLGTVVRNNIESFEGMDSHSVIKRLQAESGVCCELQKISAKPVVSAVMAAARVIVGDRLYSKIESILPEIATIEVLAPSSIAFDCMDDGEFRGLWEGICRHIISRYWPTMTVEGITDLTKLMPDNK